MRPLPETVSLHFDGASRGNPGPAAIGAVVTSAAGKVVTEVSEAIGETTNNVAEYRALIAGLETAHRLGARHITVHGDSKLVIHQVRGDWKVRDEALRGLCAQARELAGRFAEVTFTHIPRETNTAADALANQALDGRRQATTPIRPAGLSGLPEPVADELRYREVVQLRSTIRDLAGAARRFLEIEGGGGRADPAYTPARQRLEFLVDVADAVLRDAADR